MEWPRFWASSSRAKVESPRILIRSIGSICTAIFRLIDPLINPRGQPFGNANATLMIYPHSRPRDGTARRGSPAGEQREAAASLDRDQALRDLRAARHRDGRARGGS